MINFDTRLNYQKIFEVGTVSIETSSFPSTATVTHNLGFRPNARLWLEDTSGLIIPAMFNNFGAATNVYSDLVAPITGLSYQTTDSELKIKLWCFSTVTRTIHYRIYADAS